MKVLIFLCILMVGANAFSKEKSWSYTKFIMNSGPRVMSCEAVDGGYSEFVKSVKGRASQLEFAECQDTNQLGLNTNIVMCPSQSKNGNSMTAYWFKDEKSCTAAQKEGSGK